MMKPGGSHHLQWVHNAFGHLLFIFLEVITVANELLQVPTKDTTQHLRPGVQSPAEPRTPWLTSEAGVSKAVQLSSLIFEDRIFLGCKPQL